MHSPGSVYENHAKWLGPSHTLFQPINLLQELRRKDCNSMCCQQRQHPLPELRTAPFKKSPWLPDTFIGSSINFYSVVTLSLLSLPLSLLSSFPHLHKKWVSETHPVIFIRPSAMTLRDVQPKLPGITRRFSEHFFFSSWSIYQHLL